MNTIDLEMIYRCKPQVACGLNLNRGRMPLPGTSSPTYEPLGSSRAFCETPVYRRSDLVPGARLMGPAIVQEQTSTIVLYPGQNGKVDGYLNIEIDVGQA